MSLSSAEISLMQGISLTQEGEFNQLQQRIRGGEHWFFQADKEYPSEPNVRSASVQEIEKRLVQSKRQSKEESLLWEVVPYISGVTDGVGLLIQGLTRAHALKFGYKLKLTSVILYTQEGSYVVPTGFTPKKGQR